MAAFDYDVVIIGSVFGGSVTALRAAEKGYRVGVMGDGAGETKTFRRRSGISNATFGFPPRSCHPLQIFLHALFLD
jgi:choline dehydrogenase-like flavoprotein